MTPASTATRTIQQGKILIYAMSGSQFVAKVLAALEHRKIPHFVELVPVFDTKARIKALPTTDGNAKVPVMQVFVEGEKGSSDNVIIADSESILEWLDQHREAKLYPNELASEVSKRASDGKLAASVWYYNWVNDQGYHASIRRTIAEGIFPSFLTFLAPTLDLMVGSTRKGMKKKVAKVFGEDTVNDSNKMENITIDELKYFQSLLEKPHTEQPYMIPGTSMPTAPDFSIYVQLGRLWGHDGAMDKDIHAARPDLRTRPELQRLAEWHANMCQSCPIHFMGKRYKPESKL